MQDRFMPTSMRTTATTKRACNFLNRTSGASAATRHLRLPYLLEIRLGWKAEVRLSLIGAWFTSVLLPGIAAPKVLGVASMYGFVLAAYGLWAAERTSRITAEKTVDTKRPRIVPELVAKTSINYIIELFVTNVGEWAACE